MKQAASGLIGLANIAAFIFTLCAAATAQERLGAVPPKETMALLGLLKANDETLRTNKLRRLKVGTLNLPSGQVVAVDPLTLFGAEHPFTTRVNPGAYPVFVYTTDLAGWGERVALAELKFSHVEPVEWRMAVTSGQDISTLNEGEIFGYAVDAGLGSFMSPEAVKALNETEKRAKAVNPNYSDYYSDILARELENSRPSVIMHEPASDRSSNAAIFDSGIGDGMYPSYFGYSKDGAPVELVTTFLVIDGAAEEETK